MQEFFNRDMALLMALCLLYLVWVVVPLLPAVIIYRLFPETPTDTQWKILGVALKAGGASGFYFAILALGFFKFLQPTIDYVNALQHPYWTVEAPVRFVDAENKSIVPTTNSAEQIRVQPFAFDFKQTDEQTYLVTMKFSELNGETETIRLIFPEGVGFIKLKELRSTDNTNTFLKRINLSKGAPTQIRPSLKGGQNQPSVAGFSQKLQQSLETNDVRAAAK
jgi:hypothetical protein